MYMRKIAKEVTLPYSHWDALVKALKNGEAETGLGLSMRGGILTFYNAGCWKPVLPLKQYYARFAVTYKRKYDGTTKKPKLTQNTIGEVGKSMAKEYFFCLQVIQMHMKQEALASQT